MKNPSVVVMDIFQKVNDHTFLIIINETLRQYGKNPATIKDVRDMPGFHGWINIFTNRGIDLPKKEIAAMIRKNFKDMTTPHAP